LGITFYKSHHEDTRHLLPLPLPGVPLLHPEVLRGELPRPRQGALQEPDQAGQRGPGGPPQAQEGLDLEPVLCFRRTLWTGNTVCGEGRILLFGQTNIYTLLFRSLGSRRHVLIFQSKALFFQ